MLKKYQVQIFLYIVIPGLIFGWWLYVFKHPHLIHRPIATVEKAAPLQPSYFPLIQRDVLQQALQGDFPLMSRLIAEWDIDAQVLESAGLKGIQRLSSNTFLRSQLLSTKRVDFADLSPVFVVDDHGIFFSTAIHRNSFLPQTYQAAEILLALAPAEQIIALPEGMRSHGDLYPMEKVNAISLDINPYNGEKLYSRKPDIAFVAHYSHPATLYTLQQQGIPLFTFEHLESIEDIKEAILRVGHLSHHSKEAELLKIFIEAAFLAIDNQLIAIKQHTADSFKRALYLNFYAQFSVPASQTLPDQLLNRLGVIVLRPAKEMQNKWQLPIDQEQIVHLDPDLIIISTTQPVDMQKRMITTPAFASLKAIKNHHFFFVDEIIQDSPSQYIVLAYFDLFNALAKTLEAHSR